MDPRVVRLLFGRKDSSLVRLKPCPCNKWFSPLYRVGNVACTIGSWWDKRLGVVSWGWGLCPHFKFISWLYLLLRFSSLKSNSSIDNYFYISNFFWSVLELKNKTKVEGKYDQNWCKEISCFNPSAAAPLNFVLFCFGIKKQNKIPYSSCEFSFQLISS